jgi:hypothetical protein
MKKNLRLLAFYLMPVALLSSVDIAYEWSSPLKIEDGTTVPWCEFAGLRNGAVILGNHEGGPADGLILTPHAPQFVPLPFYLGAGPEGGGMFITIWFIGLVAWGAHALLRMRSKRKALKNANAKPRLMADATAQQAAICNRFGSSVSVPAANLKVGIALRTLGITPLNALRHSPEGDTSGWYVWGGERLRDDPEFFQPLHVSHLAEYCPSLLPYIGLAPGWRVLLAPGHEDVWYDESLLKTDV